MKKVRKSVSLVVTQNCNLNCVYCYEAYKSKNTMAFETAKGIVDKYLKSADTSFDECLIEFFGGEPFLNFPLIKQVCEYTWSHKWEKPYLFYASTNGTLVHGEIKEWLSRNCKRFYVGLSLDGTPEVHNINRSNSFFNIDVDFFKATWPDQSIKMTISKETLPRLAENVIYLHSLGFKIDNNFAYGIDWSDKEIIKILEIELDKLVNFYLENPQIAPSSLLNMRIEYIEGKTNQKWCGVGTNMASYDVDGVNYPCHTFLPISIGREKAALSRDIDFGNTQLIYDFMCRDCILLPICPTCYGSNFNETLDISKRNKDLCNLTKVRALACSCLLGKRILKGDYSQLANEMKKQALKAIINIQNSRIINYSG